MSDDQLPNYRDFSGKVSCPACQTQSELSYTAIPEATRTYKLPDGSTMTEHWGESRDYKCRDCSFQWTIETAHITDMDL